MDYKDIDDYELVYLVKDSDEYINSLFYKYKPLIEYFCKAYHSKYKIDYDDLFQEASLGFNYAINHYKESKNAKFKTYLYICIMSRLKDYVIKIIEDNKLYGCGELLDDLVVDNKKIDTIIDNNRYMEKLIRFKNDLDLEESLVFELRYNGFKYVEIAELLDLKYAKVYRIISKIKKEFVNKLI